MTAVALRASATANNTGKQPGDPAEVLIDGADTPCTANGLADYIPTPGDRLLVAKVGGVIEIIQYVSRGTVPYLQGADISDLQAQVNSNTDLVGQVNDYMSSVNDDLQNYKGQTDNTLGLLQGSYDILTGLGNAGVEEDYFWVGDDPALSTTKLVQISTYIQAGLYAGDHQTFSSYFNIVDLDDMGDLTFSGTAKPPMTTFYDVFTANGRTIVAGKDYNA